jgi:ribosomal protein S18 acetylase RimI-like enzyme
MHIKIRDIKIEDVQVAFEQLQDLAIITELSDRLVTTAESLEQELFKPNADWYGLVAEVDGQVSGSCLYSITNINREFNPTPAIYIDVLYVSEKFRKLGIAKKLITKVASIAKQKQIQRIELWCSKSNNIAQASYASIGATKVDMIDVLRFDVETLV